MAGIFNDDCKVAVYYFIIVRFRSSIKDIGTKFADIANNIGQQTDSVLWDNLDFNRVRLDFLAVDINQEKKIIKIKHFKDIA